MAVRSLLHKSKLPAFTDWLTAQGWTVQKPKGLYEVLRATKPDWHTLILWSRMDAKEHVSVPDNWVPMVRSFLKHDEKTTYEGVQGFCEN
jgi:hypothetical protein